MQAFIETIRNTITGRNAYIDANDDGTYDVSVYRKDENAPVFTDIGVTTLHEAREIARCMAALSYQKRY